MKLTAVDTLLWAVSLAGEAILLAVLIWRTRWTNFSAFTVWIGFHVLCDLAGMVLVYRVQNASLYSSFYWTVTIIDFALQLAVVVEIARIVLRPTGTWLKDARRQFFISGVAGTAIAAVCAYIVTPPSLSLLASVEVRAELFSSLLICELVLAITLASNRLGLGWRNHVMAIGQGLMAWSVVALVVDTVHSYFGYSRYFTGLEHLRMVTYLGALGYWCVQLWHEEPARKPISPELRNYIVALHQRVNYDLGEAER